MHLLEFITRLTCKVPEYTTCYIALADCHAKLQNLTDKMHEGESDINHL